MDPPLHPVHPPVRSSTVHNPDVEHNTGSFPRMSNAGATHHDYSGLGPLPSTQIQVNTGSALIDDFDYSDLPDLLPPPVQLHRRRQSHRLLRHCLRRGGAPSSVNVQRQHRKSLSPSNSTRNEYAFMYVAYPPARM
ncbi:hypothetical protein B0H17DRAFT_1130663 [Mycena rosella]|uniref:Uncharacterized protein n=1 Tax=Mycena rosella TaxID=1033263 RepID=A0AAD7DQ25_MYCRO|nr:hypothetical protein B0H17DRAFT_1130663 [Mycena rosella]